MKTYASDHYIFHFQPGSLAEKDIVSIAQEQERCFSRICAALKVDGLDPIHYFLLDSPEEVGVLFGGSEPINGFAVWGENKIYAVYNEDIQCIGAHEDAHLISFALNAPKSAFIAEGLAMYFDENWWGLPNETWSAYYRSIGRALSVAELLLGDGFYDADCMISYPIAGAFTKYLIDSFGMDPYLELYQVKDTPYCEAFAHIFGHSIAELEARFWAHMDRQPLDIPAIEALLQ